MHTQQATLAACEKPRVCKRQGGTAVLSQEGQGHAWGCSPPCWDELLHLPPSVFIPAGSCTADSPSTSGSSQLSSLCTLGATSTLRTP